MKVTYQLYKLSFFLYLVCILTFFAIIGWSLHLDAEIIEPWKTIGDRTFQIGLLLALLNAILLAVLANHVKRNGAVWFFASLFFAPLGLVIGFVRMIGLVNASAAASRA